MAAVKAPIDILAHPGLMTKEEAAEAAENSIYLEITTRKGHSLTNGHVAKMARQMKARLILNSDTHSPDDLVSADMARKIAMGAGMAEADIAVMSRNSEMLVKKALKE